MSADGKEKEQCSNCAYNVNRPDMKNVKYCVKRNFPIFDETQCCARYLRRKNNE